MQALDEDGGVHKTIEIATSNNGNVLRFKKILLNVNCTLRNWKNYVQFYLRLQNQSEQAFLKVVKIWTR